MSGRQLLAVTPYDTFLHRLAARTKLVLAACLCITVLLLDSPLLLYGLLLLLLFGHLWARTSLTQWSVLAAVMLAGIYGSIVSQALFYNQEPRTPLVCLLAAGEERLFFSSGLYLYQEGLVYGALQALRSSIMLSCGMLICWTTDTRELLKSLLYWRMPYQLAFMTIASLRFLPDIFNETSMVLTAQRQRGFKVWRSLRLTRLIVTLNQLLFPVLARTIRRANTLALSVEARGFNRSGRTLCFKPWVGGRLAVMLGIGAVAALVGLKTVYWLQFSGLWYDPALRTLYNGVKIWL